MERVVVPWGAGVASAVGLITADLVVERNASDRNRVDVLAPRARVELAGLSGEG